MYETQANRSRVRISKGKLKQGLQKSLKIASERLRKIVRLYSYSSFDVN